jgi:DNA-binding NarL/FixJ family response regulator
MKQSAIAQKEERLMATTILGTALNTPIAEPRPVPIDRILVIEDDGTLLKILRRLSPRKDMRSMLSPMPLVVWRDFAKECRPQWSWIYLVRIFRVCLSKKIANLIPGLPLVVLRASSDVADKVLWLEMGVDDYVNVPFSPRELVARLRALIGRTSRVNPEDLYVFADVMVDFSKTEITRGGEKIVVTPKEFTTLEFLTKNAQRVISRDELLDKVWGYEN